VARAAVAGGVLIPFGEALALSVAEGVAPGALTAAAGRGVLVGVGVACGWLVHAPANAAKMIKMSSPAASNAWRARTNLSTNTSEAE
jgi:hypothetical protein